MNSYIIKRPVTNKKLQKLKGQGEVRDAILKTLEGPYNTKGQALYWESILGTQRLIFTFTVFIKNLIVKYVLINSLCIISSGFTH